MSDQYDSPAPLPTETLPEPNLNRFPERSPSDERKATRRRALARRRGIPQDTEALVKAQEVLIAGPAFEALAENVRDYAIFLINPDGVIIYWGEGAHLLKWWTKDEAEGSHLRLLYPEGGAEDGTAEEHLRSSEEVGEYTGEGRRVRADNSTFWAHVTLTALRDRQGTLLGFCKTTRDMTVRRAAEAVVALANEAQAARDAALALAMKEIARRERLEEEAEFHRAHARGTQEYMSSVLPPDSAQKQAAPAPRHPSGDELPRQP